MLATNSHWQSLLAHKYNGKMAVYFFDSFNKKTINWSDKEREEYVKECEEKRE